MRALRRPSVTPPTLEDPELRVLAEALASTANPRSSDFPAKWWRAPDVAGALYAMHGEACAYCGTAFTRSDAGDVEHFRPKTLYPYLAYRFDNYLLSCLYCNRWKKGNRFPLVGIAAPLPATDRARIADEPRLLIDPTVDPVERWVTFDWHNRNNVPVLVPILPGDGAPSVERIVSTIDFFWLNKSFPLVKDRMNQLHDVLKAISEGKRSEVSRMASRFAPHGALARAIVQAARPEWLPSPRDEVEWLIDDLALELTLARDARELGLLIEAPAKSTKWALAYLWRDPPPPVTPGEVEARLDHHEVTDEIRPLLLKLQAG